MTLNKTTCFRNVGYTKEYATKAYEDTLPIRKALIISPVDIIFQFYGFPLI